MPSSAIPTLVTAELGQLNRNLETAMPDDQLTAPAGGVLAASSWGDEEPDAAAFEPVPVERIRAYFPNRVLFRTRGVRRAFRSVRMRVVRPRPRERRARRARAPARPDDPEADLAVVPLERFHRGVDRWLGAT